MLLRFVPAAMAEGVSSEDEINLKIRRAEESVRAGEFERAVELYEQIALADIETASRRLGPLYARLGLHEKALNFYRAVLKGRPRDSWAWYCYAYALRSKGDYLEAKKAYRKVLEISPDDVNALYGLAWTYRALDKHEEALRYFRAYARKEKRSEAAGWKARAEKESTVLAKLLRKTEEEVAERKKPEPDITDAAYDEVELVLKEASDAESSGEKEKAESLFGDALKKHARDARVHRSYIEFLLRSNRLQDAETALRLSLRNVTGFAWGRWQLVRLLLKTERPGEVEFHLRILAADHPEEPGGACARAHYLLSKGENEEADGIFDRGMRIAIEADNRSAWEFCREGALKTAEALGKPAPPDVFVEAGVKKRPKLVDSKDEKEIVKPEKVATLKKRKKAEVVTAVEEIESPGPVPPEIREGRDKFERGDYAAAGKIADAYLSKNKRSYHAWVLTAEAALRQGNLDRAHGAAERAANLFPRGAAAYRIMGLVDLKYRRRASAANNFEKFISLVSDDDPESKHLDFVKGLLKNLR